MLSRRVNIIRESELLRILRIGFIYFAVKDFLNFKVKIIVQEKRKEKNMAKKNCYYYDNFRAQIIYINLINKWYNFKKDISSYIFTLCILLHFHKNLLKIFVQDEQRKISLLFCVFLSFVYILCTYRDA